MLRVALLGAGAASVSVGLYIYAARVRKEDYKNGPTVALRCQCGQFTGHLKVPKDPAVHTGLHVVCHCADCVKWAGKVVKHGGLTSTQGDDMFMVYKGSVHFDKPELARTVRLYPHSKVHRSMTTCCETAIGGDLGGPVFSVGSNMVDPKDKAVLEASISPAINIRMKQRKNEDPTFAKDPQSFENVPPSFFGKYIGFVLRGLVEMGSPSPLPPVDPSKEPVIFKDEK